MNRRINMPAHVVVTGASTGIGRASALALQEVGFHVFGSVRTDQDAEKLWNDSAGRVTPLKLDVTDADSIAAASKAVADAVGDAGLAGLVNNAGIAVAGPLELLPIAEFRKQFEVNVIGAVAVTQAMLPLLRHARGRLVNVSSVSGGLASPYLGAYAASKFALEALTDAWRMELRNFGIHVAAVEPGPIDTPIWEKSTAEADRMSAGVDPEAMSLYKSDLEAIRQTIAKSAATAAPVSKVVEAVVHALTARRPKTRYYLGWGVRVCFKGMKMLPDRLTDCIVRKATGLK
jgi:NAD(P)-dependent dehydrogenase (short-subunit alcohol dehydrogenase family)